MDHADLLRREAVPVHDDPLRQVRDGDDGLGGVHAAPLNVVDRLVDVLAGAVELRRMNVDDQRPAGAGGNRHARRERDPVVGMDDVESFVPGHLDAPLGILFDSTDQVALVSACRPGADHTERTFLQRHHNRHRRLRPTGGRRLPGGRLVRAGDRRRHRPKLQQVPLRPLVDRRRPAFVRPGPRSAGPRQHKEHFHIQAHHGLSQPVAGRSKAAADEGRKLPAKHQDTHRAPVFSRGFLRVNFAGSPPGAPQESCYFSIEGWHGHPLSGDHEAVPGTWPRNGKAWPCHPHHSSSQERRYNVSSR